MPSRKCRLNRNFRLLPLDEGEECFANGIFVFNITKLLAHIEANLGDSPVEEVEVLPLTNYNPIHFNAETVKNVDCSRPVILAEIVPNSFNVIDGHHCIYGPTEKADNLYRPSMLKSSSMSPF